ncbi:very short patch repair endonuclease [Xanthobacter sp. V2C-8]|uniref:very short patch repair endonuclease n=1 Tax=Xanthobacter albus TaxID=3119929 RepID=UPI00372C8869
MEDRPHSHRTDVHSPERRSYNMSHIRGRNTKPEVQIRHGLHARGYRFRLQDKRLPGRPDIVLPKWHSVIQVHGCFWHGHDCPMFHLPATRPDFWRTKIDANRVRDGLTAAALAAAGWRRLTVWECALRGRVRLPVGEVLDVCEQFLRSAEGEAEIQGQWQGLDCKP